jgi:hypothetical protein
VNGDAACTVAVERGRDVPLHRVHGRVVVVTHDATYVLLGSTLACMRDSRVARPGTRTSSSIFVPVRSVSWRPDAAVRIDEGVLRSGSVTVDLRPATVWQPPDAPPDTDLAAAALRLARLAGAPHRQHVLAPLVERLTNAVSGGDADEAGTSLRALVGRGPGLTPSGDDVVTGLLAVAHRAGRRPVAVWIASMLGPLCHRTTIVGAHQLAAAGRGAFAEPVLALVDALVAADRDEADALHRAAHAQRVLAGIGATTGLDTVAGIAAGIEALAARDRAPRSSTVAVPA